MIGIESPSSPTSISPHLFLSLISLVVSADVKHHGYIKRIKANIFKITQEDRS